MAVHHVDVDDPRAGGHHLLDLGAEPREVGGEDRRGDPLAREELAAARRGGIRGGFHGQIELSIEWPQCWHFMSSVRLMRLIVPCSPQLGHWETSSKRRRQ